MNPLARGVRAVNPLECRNEPVDPADSNEAPVPRMEAPAIAPPASVSYRTVKRTLDLVLSAFLITLCAIPMLLIAFLVRRSSPGPVIFRQVRMGKNGKPFTMFKFRSMWDGVYDDVHRAYVSEMLTAGNVQPGRGPNAKYKLDGDDRVTPVGAVLRKMSLDELPQLFNVFMGSMSLVGPRPVLPWEAELLDRTHLVRFAVKPGLTGLWQVNGRSNMTMLDALELDVRYAQEKSTWLDLTILVRTVPVVLTGRGAA